MNKSRLRAVMALHDDTQSDLAKALGLSLSRVNAKINEKNNSAFKKNEIAKIQERYGLTPSEVGDIFFAENVSCKTQSCERRDA